MIVRAPRHTNPSDDALPQVLFLDIDAKNPPATHFLSHRCKTKDLKCPVFTSFRFYPQGGRYQRLTAWVWQFPIPPPVTSHQSRCRLHEDASLPRHTCAAGREHPAMLGATLQWNPASI